MLIAGYIPGYINKPEPKYVVTQRPVTLGGRHSRDADDGPACVAIDCYEPIAQSSDKWCEKHLR